MFCHVSSEQVFGVHDLSSVYRVPLLLRSQGIVEYLTKRLKLDELHLSKTMLEKGEMLERRWKDLTNGWAFYLFFRRCSLISSFSILL